MPTYKFGPTFSTYGHVKGCYSIADLEKEVGVYSATPEFVRKNCGAIANEILDTVPSDYFALADTLGLYPNLDVRIHRLYPGDFPAYPGWHCDGEYRETYFSQPDLDRIKVHKHVICTVSSHPEGVCSTRFLAREFQVTIDEPSQDHTLWGQVHKALEAEANLPHYDSQDGELVLFDSWALHKAMPARIRGWRLFFRLSMWHKPNLGNGGKLTKQEQVYKLIEGGGW